MYGKKKYKYLLIHSFYCYYFFFVRIVVASRLAIFSLGVLPMLSYMSSVAVTCFWKKCNRNRKMENVNRKYGKEQYVEK